MLCWPEYRNIRLAWLHRSTDTRRPISTCTSWPRAYVVTSLKDGSQMDCFRSSSGAVSPSEQTGRV